MTNEEREALIEQGWTPPVKVDPDIAEAWQIYHNSLPTDPMGMALAGIKRGRELERAVMGNPIPEQIQEVTPPEPVDPDMVEALDIVSEHYNSMGRADIATAFRKGNCDTIPIMEIAITAIRRGRELERAEAKPGMVWVKHDGSTICPVDRDVWVLTQTFVDNPSINRGKRLAWHSVSFYCVITPPEDK